MHRLRFVAVLVVAGATVFFGYWYFQEEGEVSPAPEETEAQRQVRRSVPHNVSPELVNEVLRMEAQEKHIAETAWAKEMLAQECGRTIERLWDQINAATNFVHWPKSGKEGEGVTQRAQRTQREGEENWETVATLEEGGSSKSFEGKGKLGVLAQFAVAEVQFGKWDSVEELAHGIRVVRSVGDGQALRKGEWKDWLASVMREGWALEQIEFRQNRFDVTDKGEPAQSGFYFAANLVNASRNERLSIEGDLDLDWGSKDDEGFYSVTKVDASKLTVKARGGDPLFKLVRDDEIVPEGQSRLIDPLIVYDLNGDGLSEIILAARNLVYRNQGNFQFTQEALCRFPEEYIGTALMADVNGDGMVDFISAKWEGLFVSYGSPGGTFDTKARLTWKASAPLQKAMVITCGDIDADGDLDLFVGQYKDPYEGGVTPHPFFEAKDGHPAYLLVNDGLGNFRDKTTEAGLAAKRLRRTFSASFVDFDRDDDLDLMVVSDFAGVDFYANDGTGKFTDVTGTWVKDWHARHGFGMAHSIADFNNDGLLDVLMIGMTSPTLDRLKYMGLARAKDPRERELEAAMTYGNRLMFGKEGGGFEQRAMSDSIARASWAWGCASFDFDNDGYTDVYIANGFQSRGTVRDSEGDYWLHDRFLESEMGVDAINLYFKSSGARIRGNERSFGGHERNRLYWNRAGTNFLEVGYLMGVSLGADSRNVVAEDLDADGKVDLLVTTMESWPKEKQTLKVYRNGAEGERSCVELAMSASQIGKVQGSRPGEKGAVGVYATGGGFRSQSAAKARLGSSGGKTR
jgi:enediyne biosynthesis protein E4